MSTPSLSTYVRNKGEEREREMQTAFPAKVLDWDSSTNTVQLEPQFVETWVLRDGTRTQEEAENTYIDNVPVLFPRSGDWSITFPIETGSYGLVVCTKFSLDVWRNQARRVDPGNLRRFGMSGAVFHPVNLHPNSSTLKAPGDFTASLMEIGDHDKNMRFVALANLVNSELSSIKDALDTHTHLPGTFSNSGGAVTGVSGGKSTQPYTAGDVASATVKVSE